MHPRHFLTFRHLAALAVLTAHAFALSGKPPTALLTAFPSLAGFGGFGVTLFFIISGFLISQSWSQSPDAKGFVQKRFLRVFPGLLGCLLFSILVGACFTSMPQNLYWQHSGVREFFINNLLLQTHLELPGVFLENPVPNAVNGSLWTIPIEVTCYLAILLLGMAGLLKNRWMANLSLLVLLALAIGFGDRALLFNQMAWREALPGYYSAFLFGALAYQNQNWLPKSPVLAAGALIVAWWWLPASALTHYLVIASLALFVVNLALALGRRWPETRGSIDLSYGTYLYGFPIEQALVAAFPAFGGWTVLALAIPLCLVFSSLSWYLIERPALRVIRR
ncbi:MAG: acyltransferase [Pseudomonadota bacterium]